MFTKALAAALLLPGLFNLVIAEPIVHPRVEPSAGCNRNNCLRALLNTEGHFSTRGGTADCSSYLVSTVTPPTATFTVSVTPATQTDQVDVTDTVFTTLTPEVTLTNTRTLTVTSPYVSAVPVKRAVPEGADDPSLQNLPVVHKRAGTLPDYAAKACAADKEGDSVTARFISACSCLGVTATTATLPTPSTTITVSVTATTLITVTHDETATRTAGTLTRTVSTDTIVYPTCRFAQNCEVPDLNDGVLGPVCGGGVNSGHGCICSIAAGAGRRGHCAECVPLTGVYGGGVCNFSGDCCEGTCVLYGSNWGYCRPE